MLHSVCQQILKTQQWSQDWKRSVSFQSERKAMPKNVQSKVTQSCLTLCDPMDCSLPGSSICGIFQARVVEWAAISFSNYCTIALISHASKLRLKILQARLQQYVNRELADVQAGFRKGRGTKLPISAGSSKKQESSKKTSIFALLTMPKPLTVWITINCGKF